VAPLPEAAREADAEAERPAGAALPVVHARPLPLPYALPQ